MRDEKHIFSNIYSPTGTVCTFMFHIDYNWPLTFAWVYVRDRVEPMENNAKQRNYAQWKGMPLVVCILMSTSMTLRNYDSKEMNTGKIFFEKCAICVCYRHLGSNRTYASTWCLDKLSHSSKRHCLQGVLTGVIFLLSQCLVLHLLRPQKLFWREESFNSLWSIGIENIKVSIIATPRSKHCGNNGLQWTFYVWRFFHSYVVLAMPIVLRLMMIYVPGGIQRKQIFSSLYLIRLQ